MPKLCLWLQALWLQALWLRAWFLRLWVPALLLQPVKSQIWDKAWLKLFCSSIFVHSKSLTHSFQIILTLSTKIQKRSHVQFRCFTGLLFLLNNGCLATTLHCAARKLHIDSSLSTGGWPAGCNQDQEIKRKSIDLMYKYVYIYIYIHIYIYIYTQTHASLKMEQTLQDSLKGLLPKNWLINKLEISQNDRAMSTGVETTRRSCPSLGGFKPVLVGWFKPSCWSVELLMLHQYLCIINIDIYIYIL